MLKKHIWQPVCMCSVSNIVTETVGYCYWSSENKCSLKKIKNKKKGALNTACFFFPPNSQSKIWSKERKISVWIQAYPPLSEIRNKWFYENEVRTKRGRLNFERDAFPLSGLCAGFPAKPTKPMVALWKVHLLVLFIFWFNCIFLNFSNYNSTEEQRNSFFFFFFTYRYVVS